MLLQAEMDRRLGCDDRAVLEIGEVDFRTGSRRRRAADRGGSRSSRDVHLDALRHHGWRVGNVILVAHQKLQRMVAGLERDFRFGLSGAEVQMVEVARDRLIERRQIGVDQQMVMAGVLAIRSRGRDPHVPQPEIERHFFRNRRAVLEVHEIDLGAGRRRGRAACLLTVGEHNRARECGGRKQDRKPPD